MSLTPTEPFRAPTVDMLSVRVVVDLFFDQFMPKPTHPHVAVEHVSRIPRPRAGTTLAGEWGLSLHLESRDGRAAQGQYLLDFGYTPEILHRNFDLLGIEPEKLDGLILSHSHRDHYGGLVGFVEHHRDRMRDDLKLYTGGDLTFREKWLGSRDERADVVGRARRRGARPPRRSRPCAATTRTRSPAPFTRGQIARQLVRARAAQHAGRADPGRPFHRGGAARPAGARQASRRARDLLCRAGARAGGDLVLRPLRADQHDQDREGGVGVDEAARGDRRVPPRRRAARLHRAHGRRAEGARPRRRRADALHRPRLHRRGRRARCRSRSCCRTPAAASPSGSERCACSIRASA